MIASTRYLLAIWFIANGMRGSVTAQDAASFGALVVRQHSNEPILWEDEAKLFIKKDALNILPEGRGRVSVKTRPMVLPPMSLFECRMTCRRVPGTKVQAQLHFTLADGPSLRHVFYFQTSEVPRHSHFPLAPWKQTYSQGFCVPDGVKGGVLEYIVEAGQGELTPGFEIFELELVLKARLNLRGITGADLVQVDSVPRLTEQGVPFGWQVWLNARPTFELNTDEGNSFLRIPNEESFLMALATPIPIESGGMYELSYMARGHGEITSMAHPLGPSRYYPLPIRVGDPQSVESKFSGNGWKRFSRFWYASARHATTARILLAINVRKGGLDIDDVQFRQVGMVMSEF